MVLWYRQIKTLNHKLCRRGGAAAVGREPGAAAARAGPGVRALRRRQNHAAAAAGTSGSIAIGGGAQGLGQGQGQSAATRLARVGLVFQFPERHFLGDTLQEARLAIYLTPADSACW